MKLKVSRSAGSVLGLSVMLGFFFPGKKHYNEFHAVKMARQLMVDDEGNSEDEDKQDDSEMGEKFKNSKSGSNSPMDTETKD